MDGRVVRRSAAVGVAVAALVVGVVVWMADGGGDPRADAARREVQAFLDDWSRGRTERAARRTDAPADAADLLASVQRGLRPQQARMTAGAAERRGGAYAVPFEAELELEALGGWRYASEAVAEPRGDAWRLRWRPALLHPKLREHQTLVLTTERAERAPILAVDGTPLAEDARVWSVSIWPAKLSRPERAYAAIEDLGTDVDIPRLKNRVAAAEPDQSVPVVTLREGVYLRHRERLLKIAGLQFVDSMQPVARRARSLVGTVQPGTDKGVSGFQARYDGQLHAAPSAEVVTADRDTGQPLRTLARQRAGKGTPVRTTVDPGVQRAAEEVLAGVGKNASIVAVEPGSGHVLAVADTAEAGEARSLTGRFPPGSTFKTVTAAALLEGGLAPGDRVGCPRYATVGGQRFENQGEFALPADATFADAFARSCNTAFAGLAEELGDEALTRTARAFGVGGTWQVGAATFDGSVPPAQGANDKAAAAIGQGRVEASPLVLASVAATVKEGRFRQPVIVPDAVDDPYRAPERLDERTYERLRELMRAVVTEGSGSALRGLPGRPHAKTGTAEYGTERPPRTHAWMIGYVERPDVAFSVLIEDGGSGGRDAGPVAAAFLRALG